MSCISETEEEERDSLCLRVYSSTPCVGGFDQVTGIFRIEKFSDPRMDILKIASEVVEKKWSSSEIENVERRVTRERLEQLFEYAVFRKLRTLARYYDPSLKSYLLAELSSICVEVSREGRASLCDQDHEER